MKVWPQHIYQACPRMSTKMSQRSYGLVPYVARLLLSAKINEKNMRKLACFIIIFPILSFANDMPVKTELAVLLEESIKESGLSINVVNITEKSININRIEGIDVCAPAAKNNVQALQKIFTKHKDFRMTISIYGVYVKTKSGKMKFLDGKNPKIKSKLGKCKYLYVSVY